MQKGNALLIVGILIGLLLLIGGGFFLFKNLANTTTYSEDVEKQLNLDEKSGTQAPSADNKYVIYSSESFADYADKRRVIFFYANWCPTCRPADAEFSANENKLPSDVVVVRANYNDTETDSSEKDLAQQYGITYQHTFVQIDAQGKQVAKWNGGGLAELLENIK